MPLCPRRGFGPDPRLRAIVSGVRRGPLLQTSCRGPCERDTEREGERAEAWAAFGYLKAPREWRESLGSQWKVTRNRISPDLRTRIGAELRTASA